MTKKETLLRELKMLNLRTQKVLEQLAELEGIDENDVQEEIEDSVIKKFLRDLGCSPETKAYHIAVEAIKFQRKWPRCKIGDIYQDLGERNGMNYFAVERNIRVIRKKAIEKIESKPIGEKIFGQYIKRQERITNAMFIAISAEYISDLLMQM